MPVKGGERGVPALPIQALRQAIERELSLVSLRQVARETELSPNTIKNFLHGSIPRRTTRVRLEAWLATRQPGDRPPTVGNFLRAVSALTPDLPEREATLLGREMSRLLLDSYERRRLPPPRWVRELVRHYGS